MVVVKLTSWLRFQVQPQVVESNPESRDVVIVARTLVMPSNQMVPVHLLNVWPVGITVSKGTTIARMEAITVVAATSDSETTPKHQLIEDMVTM